MTPCECETLSDEPIRGHNKHHLVDSIGRTYLQLDGTRRCRLLCIEVPWLWVYLRVCVCAIDGRGYLVRVNMRSNRRTFKLYTLVYVVMAGP